MKQYRIKVTDVKTGEVEISIIDLTDSQVAELVALGVNLTPEAFEAIGTVKA